MQGVSKRYNGYVCYWLYNLAHAGTRGHKCKREWMTTDINYQYRMENGQAWSASLKFRHMCVNNRIYFLDSNPEFNMYGYRIMARDDSCAVLAARVVQAVFSVQHRPSSTKNDDESEKCYNVSMIR